MVFFDLEKVYDSVSGGVFWRCLEVRGVLWIIKDMYKGEKINVRFYIDLGLYYGSFKLFFFCFEFG